MRIRAVAFSAALVLTVGFAVPIWADPIVTIDQQYNPVSPCCAYQIAGLELGQGFTPTLPGLDASFGEPGGT